MVLGVPQGSKVGRLLFIFYVNDLPFTVSFEIIQFPHDTTMLVKASSSSLAVNQAFKDISSIENWFHQNCLHVNSSKTHILHFHNIPLTLKIYLLRLKQGKQFNQLLGPNFWV